MTRWTMSVSSPSTRRRITVGPRRPRRKTSTTAAPRKPPHAQKATKKYNASGILEDSPMNEDGESGNGAATAVDIGPTEPLAPKPVAARKDPIVVGAGRTRSLSNNPAPQNVDWSSVGRNDPCPCGSGKKFKKCHGANL